MRFRTYERRLPLRHTIFHKFTAQPLARSVVAAPRRRRSVAVGPHEIASGMQCDPGLTNRYYHCGATYFTSSPPHIYTCRDAGKIDKTHLPTLTKRRRVARALSIFAAKTQASHHLRNVFSFGPRGLKRVDDAVRSWTEQILCHICQRGVAERWHGSDRLARQAGSARTTLPRRVRSHRAPQPRRCGASRDRQ